MYYTAISSKNYVITRHHLPFPNFVVVSFQSNRMQSSTSVLLLFIMCDCLSDHYNTVTGKPLGKNGCHIFRLLMPRSVSLRPTFVFPYPAIILHQLRVVLWCTCIVTSQLVLHFIKKKPEQPLRVGFLPVVRLPKDRDSSFLRWVEINNNNNKYICYNIVVI